MENYVTICFNISTHEYESLIAHFNGYGIEKEGEDTIDYSLSELVQGKVKNEDKKNPLFISVLSR